MRPRYCSMCRRYHAPREECWGDVVGYTVCAVGFLLFVIAVLVGCSHAVAVGVCDDDCDADDDSDAGGDCDSALSDAGGDCDGDADGDGDVVDGSVDDGPCIWPVLWSAALGTYPDGPEPYDLEEYPSALLVWPDGFAVFRLAARVEELGADVELFIVVDADADTDGELCTYPGCSPGLGAGLTVAAAPGTPGGCDAAGGASEALGYVRGLSGDGVVAFEFQFVGEDGCQAQIVEGELVVPSA